MRIKQNMHSKAMYHSSTFGLTFGGNATLDDLGIEEDANNNSNSCSNLGIAYEIPSGQTDTFLVGSTNFEVSDIEVFQIIWQFILWYNNIVVQNKDLERQLPVVIEEIFWKEGEEYYN